MRIRKGTAKLLLLLAALLAASCLFTALKFSTFNAPATAVGLVRVCLLDAPYSQIGFLNPVYLGSPDGGFDLFISTMEDMGYTHHPEEQMGSLHWFEDGDGNWVKVLFYINAYYSKWIWC